MVSIVQDLIREQNLGIPVCSNR